MVNKSTEESIFENDSEDEWAATYKTCLALAMKGKQLLGAPAQRSTPCPPAGSASSEPAAQPAAKIRIDVPAGGVDQDTAARWLPPGWTITKSESRYPYWWVRETATGRNAAKSFTNTGETDVSAMMLVIAKAWSMQGQSAEGDCPWDLSSIAL